VHQLKSETPISDLVRTKDRKAPKADCLVCRLLGEGGGVGTLQRLGEGRAKHHHKQVVSLTFTKKIVKNNLYFVETSYKI
jgi:hypothetical protein